MAEIHITIDPESFHKLVRGEPVEIRNMNSVGSADSHVHVLLSDLGYWKMIGCIHGAIASEGECRH